VSNITLLDHYQGPCRHRVAAPVSGGQLSQNRTCAVHIRLFGTTGCDPGSRPGYDLDIFQTRFNWAGAPMFARSVCLRCRSETSPLALQWRFGSARSTTAA
jgi:hypothetical protein